MGDIERFGFIDEASGYEPLYWGKTNDVSPHGISGEEYVRYSDHAARVAELKAQRAPGYLIENLNQHYKMLASTGNPEDAAYETIRLGSEMTERIRHDIREAITLLSAVQPVPEAGE